MQRRFVTSLPPLGGLKLEERTDAPCYAPAGSKERVEAYRQRWEAGLPLWHPGDSSEVLEPRRVIVEPKQPAVLEVNLRELVGAASESLRNRE